MYKTRLAKQHLHWACRTCFAFLSPLIKHPLTFMEKPRWHRARLSPSSSLHEKTPPLAWVSLSFVQWHLYVNMPKLSPPILPASQWLGPNKSSSVRLWQGLVGCATLCPIPTAVLPWPSRKHPPAPEVSYFSGAVNQGFWLTSVPATHTGPKMFSFLLC